MGLLIVIFAAGFSEAVGRLGGLDLAEHLYFDLWHQVSGCRYKPERAVIVVVDDEMLLNHQDEPMVFWGPYFANAIEVLRRAGARVVGLDFLFAASAESWLEKLGASGGSMSRTYDIPMRMQLASGQVILSGSAVIGRDGKREVLLPVRDYLFSLPQMVDDVGLTNFYSDEDGVVRRFVPSVYDEKGEMLGATFAVLLALRSSDSQPDDNSRLMSEYGLSGIAFPLRISFAGPPSSIPRISITQLLGSRAEADAEALNLRGKIVIIGSEYTGMQDVHQTPYSRPFFHLKPRMMSGAEVHANIVETLLTRRFLRDVPAGFRIFFLLVLLSSGTILFFRLSNWKGAGAAFLLALLWSALAFLLFRTYWIIPVAGPQFALALCYIGTLGARFTGEERERKRIREIFGRYVSDDVVEEILASGERVDLGGAMLRVSVLFSDIRSFTSISEQLNPHEVVEMLNGYFSRVCEPIMNQGGTVDKFIGDAIMAVFGSPHPHSDHAMRAVRAALAMRKQADLFSAWMKARFPDRSLPDFRIGIGIHTGEAVIGNIGSPNRMEFTAIGDTVNVASRLESMTKELGWTIVASADCVHAAGPGVVQGGRAQISVKGREKKVDVFEIAGLEILDSDAKEGFGK